MNELMNEQKWTNECMNQKYSLQCPALVSVQRLPLILDLCKQWRQMCSKGEHSPARSILWPEKNINGPCLHTLSPAGRWLHAGLSDRKNSCPRSLSSFSWVAMICELPCSSSSSIGPLLGLTISLVMRIPKTWPAPCAYCIMYTTYSRHY